MSRAESDPGFAAVVAIAQQWHDEEYPDVLVQWNEPSLYAFSVPPYIKIGWSRLVYHREYQLAKGQGKPLTMPEGMPRKTGGKLIAAWPAARNEERPAHRELAAHNVIGEWFHHNDAVTAWIAAKVTQARGLIGATP